MMKVPVATKHFAAGQTEMNAGIAQLVEHDLAKVGVASSSLVSRSNFTSLHLSSGPVTAYSLRRPVQLLLGCTEQVRTFGWVAEWSCSGLQLRVRRFDSDPSLHFSCNTVLPLQCARPDAIREASSQIAVLRQLDRDAIRISEIELITATGSIRRIPADIRWQTMLEQLCRQRIGVVIVHTNA